MSETTTSPTHAHMLVGDTLECPVIKLAIARFGRELGMELLWEQTCFPFCDEIAMGQLLQLIAMADRGEEPVLFDDDALESP
jgi:hypothetical protein